MADDERMDVASALEAYQRQLDAISRQIDFLQTVLDDLARARTTLESVSGEGKVEVLVPLGATNFVRAKLSGDDHVISSIGAGYSVERPRTEAIKGIEEREKSVQRELERLMQGAIEIQQEAARVQAALQEQQ